VSCKHFWKIVGGRWHWFHGHALARCVHCPAWTVVEYGKGIGPCPHVVAQLLGVITELESDEED